MNKRINDAEIDQLIKEAFEVTDDQLAEILDCAEKEAELQGELFAAPPKGGFEDVMRRVAESEKEEAPKQKAFRVKKIVRPLLVAAVLGTIVLGAGIGVSGQREFEFVKRIKSEYSIGYNNTDSLKINDTVDQAYQTIRDELGIRPVMLEYMPKGMKFEKVTIEKGRAIITFSYNENYLYMEQTLKSVGALYDSVSDRTAYKVIEHRGLGLIDVYSNELKGENPEYSAHFKIDNAHYYINGIIQETEFIKIVEQLQYYE